MPLATCFYPSLCLFEPLSKSHSVLYTSLSRRFSTFNHGNPNIAILGGGITGLATAFYLSKILPTQSRIEVFEGSDRLGGWLRSTSVNVGTGNVVFEAGPRSIRPGSASGLVTLDLIGELGLGEQILAVSKSSDAARNRFIYYPDHLVRLPTASGGIWNGLQTLTSEPLFDGMISGLLTEFLKSRRVEEHQDESVGSFISRRLGAPVADNIISAVFHGIYAGDIYDLSARTILPALWSMEWKHSSIIKSLLKQAFGGPHPISIDDFEVLRDNSNPLTRARSFPEHIRKASIITLKQGLYGIVTSLEDHLQRAPNVTIHKGTYVHNLELESSSADAKISMQTKTPLDPKAQDQRKFSHIFSSISTKALASTIIDPQLSKRLCTIKSVTVMVVNLFYENPSLTQARGFGYLLPQSLPLDQNPELALGVIFDSYATPGQDNVQGTKITVMLGGHWWNDIVEYPDEEEGVRLAKALLKRHLSIEEDPREVRVSLQKDCIPQYQVGHHERMLKISRDLKRAFKGRLRVVGSSYTGVGVNDCIRAARNLVRDFHNGTGQTGLEKFEREEQWMWMVPQLANVQ